MMDGEVRDSRESCGERARGRQRERERERKRKRKKEREREAERERLAHQVDLSQRLQVNHVSVLQ